MLLNILRDWRAVMMKFKEIVRVMMCDFTIERNGHFYYKFIYDEDMEKANIPNKIMEDKVLSVINDNTELTIFLVN